MNCLECAQGTGTSSVTLFMAWCEEWQGMADDRGVLRLVCDRLCDNEFKLPSSVAAAPSGF
jgi:hypothetical protein